MRKRCLLLFLGDIVLIYLSLFLMVKIGFWSRFNWAILEKHFLPFSFVYLFWLIIIYIFGLYDLTLIRPNPNLAIRIGEATLLFFTIGIVLFYLTPFLKITPKTNLLINAIIFGILILIWRRFFHFIFASYVFQRVAFLGKNPLSKNLAKEISKNPQFGYKVVGFLNLKEEIKKQIKNKRIDTLIIAKDLSKNPRLAKKLYQCLPLKINFINLAQAYELLLQKVPIDFLNQSWFLENLSEGEKRVYDKSKRLGDIILSFLIIIITSPLWLLFALLIKIEDKGPVFYKQRRIGKNNAIFYLIKFRSMKEGAEKGKPVWAKEKDKRVTKIGGFLRRIHLDELPQMINILKGDISLVGPRPERPQFVKKLEKEIPHYHLRHIIKPGFTGWAQIKFRYARSLKDSHQKLEYDLYYIKNRSIFLDLGILLKTFQLFFRK